jgi:hypothetical protein
MTMKHLERQGAKVASPEKKRKLTSWSNVYGSTVRWKKCRKRTPLKTEFPLGEGELGRRILSNNWPNGWSTLVTPEPEILDILEWLKHIG